MSTSWNARCADHPNAGTMLYDDFQGSGDNGALRLAKIWNNRDRIVAIAELFNDELDAMLEIDGYIPVGTRTRGWLTEHRFCRVEFVSEYGVIRSARDLTPQPPHHCGTCTCEPGRARAYSDEQWAKIKEAS